MLLASCAKAAVTRNHFDLSSLGTQIHRSNSASHLMAVFILAKSIRKLILI